MTATNSGGSASVSFKVTVTGAVIGSDTIAALGTPSADFKAVAVSAPLIAGAGAQMNGVYSANSIVALALAALKGDTGSARDRLIAQLKWLMDTPSRNPLMCGAFADNTSSLVAAAIAITRKSPATWDLLGTATQTRCDLAMKAAAFDGAFVGSDANPWYGTSGGKPRTLRGWPATGGSSLKTANFNLSGMAPAMMLISMAYLGGPAAWRSFLQTTTPANLRAQLAAANLDGGNLYKTMNWRNEGYTGDVGQGPTCRPTPRPTPRSSAR